VIMMIINYDEELCSPMTQLCVLLYVCLSVYVWLVTVVIILRV